MAAEGAAPRLAYLTPMERDEATATGLALLTPEQLDVERWAREGASPERFLAGVLSRALQLCELAPGTVALAGSSPGGRLVAACEELRGEGWSFVDGGEIVLRLRKRKPARAVAEVRRTATGLVATFRHLAGLLAATAVRDGELWLGAERLTVGELRSRAGQELARHGLEQPAGNIVAPAEEGAVPHSTGSDRRVLRAGESLVVDLFPRGELYADCTRTFAVGEPGEGLATAHARVAAALADAHRAARPGVRGWDLQRRVCDRFAACELPTPISHRGTLRGYVHGLGHGVGYAVHEYPSFREHGGDETVLAAGDVFTLEPGLYEPEEGYAVRLEDTVALDDDGRLENLTPLPYDLDPRAW